MRTDGLREIAFTIRTVQKDGLRGAGLTRAHYDGLLDVVGKAVLPEAADEIDRLRKALVEAGRCVMCDDGIYTVYDTVAKDGEWVEVVAGTEVCPNCDGTTIPADLSSSTQAAVAAAKEQIDA